MNTKTTGILIILIGMAYITIDGWLLSWWIVTDYVKFGPAFFSNHSFYSSNTFFTFWALSVPLGSIIIALGLSLYMRLEKNRIVIFVAGSFMLLAWLGLWSQSILYPVIYGVGGGLILISFCFAIWSLARTRRIDKRKAKNALDLRAIAYVFFVITAWGMCGLLGIPSFGLRPDKLLEYNAHGTLVTMGAKILICFTLGWIFLAWSQYAEYRSYKGEFLSKPGSVDEKN